MERTKRDPATVDAVVKDLTTRWRAWEERIGQEAGQADDDDTEADEPTRVRKATRPRKAQ